MSNDKWKQFVYHIGLPEPLGELDVRAELFSEPYQQAEASMEKVKGWMFEEIVGDAVVASNPNPMRSALSQEDLVQPDCDHPECQGHSDEFGIDAKCHPGAGLRARYSTLGALTLFCATCNEEVVRIAVLPLHERQRAAMLARLEQRKQKRDKLIKEALDER